jgi:hypothetical protein
MIETGNSYFWVFGGCSRVRVPRGEISNDEISVGIVEGS